MTDGIQTGQRVGSRIRAAMLAAGLTQQQVADELGMLQSQVSRRLNGQITFDVVEIEKVAQLCGVSAASFFRDEVAA